MVVIEMEWEVVSWALKKTVVEHLSHWIQFFIAKGKRRN
jgi:hypothetical protein